MGEQAKREIEWAGGVGIRVERQGPFAVWTLDREANRNALSRAAVRELGRLARDAALDRTLRAVVITGAGDKAFSAGADLKERRTMDEDDVRNFLPLYRASFGAIDRLPMPTFAAINGAAFGGGMELALACDFRVMAPHAKIGLTETSLAIIPGAGGTQRLTRLVGVAKAKELIVFARRMTADDALRLGVVHRVAAEGQSALACALEMAAPLADSAPVAIAAALDAIDAAPDLDLEAGLSHELACYERTLVTGDRLEALAAFAEKRKPSFRGE